MLKQSKRISGRALIPKILKHGDVFKTSFFVLRWETNKLPTNRYAIVLSKKLEKSAVKRNKKRRQIYEILRRHEYQRKAVPSKENFDIIVLVREKALKLPFSELEPTLVSLVQTPHGS